MSRVVLIDIDGTLFNSNSTFDFLDSLPHGKWYEFYRKVGASIFGRIVNKLAIILFSKDIIRMIGINCLKGYSQKKLLTLGEEFYDNFLLQRKNSEVFNMLDEEKKNDSKIILASATLDFLSEIIKKRVMADYAIATELKYKKGCCVGKILKDRLGRKMEALVETGISFPVDMTITDNVTDARLLLDSLSRVIVIYPREANKWARIIKKYNFKDAKLLHYE